ncbi:hypothetical protein ACFQZK_00355 [Rhodococcus aetherivorans]
MIEKHAQIGSDRLNQLLSTHLIPAHLLRADDFDGFFQQRREWLCQLVEDAIGKPIQRDIDEGHAEEDSSQFAPEELIEEPSQTG